MAENEIDFVKWARAEIVGDPRSSLSLEEATVAWLRASGHAESAIRATFASKQAAAQTMGLVRKELESAGILPVASVITLNGRRLRGWRGFNLRSQTKPRAPVAPEAPSQPEIVETIDHVEEAVAEIEARASARDSKKVIQALAKEIKTLRERVRIIDEASALVRPVHPERARSPLKRQATAFVALSDLHVEEPVNPASVNGLNEFSLAIAGRDLASIGHSVRWLLDMHRERFDIDKLVVWLGGDLLTGHIHEDLAETAELSPVQAIAWLFERLGLVLDFFAEDPRTLEIVVPCSIGNHGRTTKERRVSTAIDHSFEWLLYYMLASKYAGHPKIRVIVPQGALTYLDVGPLVMRLTHGDTVGFQGGVGGITIPINKAIAQWNVAKRADLTVMGHWHQYMSLEHLIVNGSLVGYSPYSIQIRAGFEVSRQAFALIDESRGKCCSTPIWMPRRLQANADPSGSDHEGE